MAKAIAWESKAEAFATLSTTESELMGYTDALTLGERVGAVANVLELNALDREGACTLRGDTSSAFSRCSLVVDRGVRDT